MKAGIAAHHGWREATTDDWQTHQITGPMAGCTLWVRADGIRHGWAFLQNSQSATEFKTSLKIANEMLAAQQESHPYSFLPDDEIVAATLEKD